jgi:hypothetical protein
MAVSIVAGALKHGLYTAEAEGEQKLACELLTQSRELLIDGNRLNQRCLRKVVLFRMFGV